MSFRDGSRVFHLPGNSGGDLALKTGGKLFRHTSLTNRIWCPIYWNAAKRYYSKYTDPRVENPFEVHWIDPTEISRWSGREEAATKRPEAIGSVQGGDWDRSEPTYEHWPPEYQDALVSDPWDESEFYRSFEQHFLEGVPWVDTPFVNTALFLVENGQPAWNSATTRREVFERAAEIDVLYEQIESSGYMSQRQLHCKGIENPYGDLRYILAQEITVDIGRDGEPLFVGSKHRRAIAQILGIDRVPVIVLCRHIESLGGS